MSVRFGPWIEHDGNRIDLPNNTQLELRVRGTRNQFRPADFERVKLDYPGWFWRWETVRTGWISKKSMRICDDPNYAPITHYRVRQPRAIDQLRRIAAEPQDIEVPA